MKTLTNKLELNFDFQEIKNDLKIWRFFQESGRDIYFSSAILDGLITESGFVKSVVHTSRDCFYALTNSNVTKYDLNPLIEDDEKVGGEDDYLFEEILPGDVPPRWLAQLLLNSLALPLFGESSRLSNLTGKLYYFHPRLSKKNEIVAVEILIDKNLQLSVQAKRFISASLRHKAWPIPKERYKMQWRYPYYVKEPNTLTLKRVFNPRVKIGKGNQIDPMHAFLPKGLPGKRVTVNFLDFRPESFFESKHGIMFDLWEGIQERLSSYMKVRLVTLSLKAKGHIVFSQDNSSFRRNYLRNICKKWGFYVVDHVLSEKSQNIVDGLQTSCSIELGIEPVLRKKMPSKGVVFSITHSPEEYRKYGRDPYQVSKTELVTQHIIVDNTNDITGRINKLLDELSIKADLVNRRIGIVDWDQFIFLEDWSFSTRVRFKVGKDTFKYYIFQITIFQDGAFKFDQYEEGTPLFNRLNTYLKEYTCEWIITTSTGDLMAIENSGLWPLWNFLDLGRKYSEVEKNLNERFHRKDIIAILNSCQKGIRPDWKKRFSYGFDKVREQLADTGIITVNGVLNSFRGEKIDKNTLVEEGKIRYSFGQMTPIKKYLVEFLKLKTGKSYWVYLRGQAEMQRLFGNTGGVNYLLDGDNENSAYYYVGGQNPRGIKQTISTAWILRKVTCLKGSNRFEELLKTMAVGFIREGQLTVLPFPVKYLREYVDSYRRELNLSIAEEDLII